ncbi:MAG: type II secretion system protein [Phycisphaerales bacterium]|nr:MAG: type II secretion system protein [Phycisphaerales bacterium]
MTRYRRTGFTLIELLVVVSIIGVLMAVLVPALGRAREQAKFVRCKANLKSYGVLALMYIDDNDGIMPSAWTSFYNSHQEYRGEPHRYCRWHNPDYDLEQHPEYAGPFWRYLKGKDIHICPSFPKIAKRYGPVHPEHVDGVPIVPNYSYSMNSYLGSTENTPKSMTGIKRHSEVFFFGEENLWITAPYNRYAFNDTAMCVYQQWDSFGTFHLTRDPEEGVVNAVFLDGQVQTVHREDSWRYCAPDGASKSPLNDQAL